MRTWVLPLIVVVSVTRTPGQSVTEEDGPAAPRRCGGFTLIELLVVMAIIAVLAAILTPVVANAVEHSRAVSCQTRLRQWQNGLSRHLMATNGVLPRRGQGVQPLSQIARPEDWFNALAPYMDSPAYQDLVASGAQPAPKQTSVFICPTAVAPSQGLSTYFLPLAMNMYLSPWIRPEPHRLSELPSPNTLAFMADAAGPYASVVPSKKGYDVVPRHLGKANVLFLDGHVAAYDGTYLGCGVGEPSRGDIRWQTLSTGVNQAPVE
ncbi:MAG: prepilin-type N-terminal cleavage/methylation domain-containing protein [Planctomycetaceae bacterium]|nr:prepilin-type N-terminal cleavage/methylation domain-containing protein [Planctomycetaceae bacterium]